MLITPSKNSTKKGTYNNGSNIKQSLIIGNAFNVFESSMPSFANIVKEVKTIVGIVVKNTSTRHCNKKRKLK